MPRIGCLRIPHFPAWTLERKSGCAPPVLVTESGRVVAASRSARRRGVVRGMRPEQAERLDGSARRTPRDAELEEAMWNDVVNRVHETTPRVAPIEKGIMYFEPRDHTKTEALIHRLSAQAAVAPARSFARLAAFRSSPRSILQLEAGDVPAFLGQFKTKWLPETTRIPPELAERLILFGYRSLGSLRTLSKKHLRDQFGETGAYLHRLLHPSGEERVGMMSPLPRIAERHAFERAAREPGDLKPTLDALVEAACARFSNKHCQRVEVRLITRSGDEHIQSRVLRGLTQEEKIIAQQAHILLDKLLDQERYIRAIELVLGALQGPTGRQASLFSEREDALKAIQAVKRRYPQALLRATTDAHAVFEEERFCFEPIEIP